MTDRERADRMMKRRRLDRHDEVVAHFAGAPDEDELTDEEQDEELRAALEALSDDEWISADEAKRRLLGD